MAFAARLESDPSLQLAIHEWLRAAPERPDEVDPNDWLRFEQAKHERLLQVA